LRLVTVRLTRQTLVEYVLSGTHLGTINFPSKVVFLMQITWILSITWAILALCLAVWSAVKYFRELQRESTGWAVRNCVTTLIESHVFFFARWARNSNAAILFALKLRTSFVAVSCLQLGYISRKLLVCQPIADIHLTNPCHVMLGHNFRGISDFSQPPYNCPRRADVCTRTTPYPWCSRMSCQACDQLRWSNRHGFILCPRWHTHFNRRWCSRPRVIECSVDEYYYMICLLSTWDLDRWCEKVSIWRRNER
jgi:hypothetical protein